VPVEHFYGSLGRPAPTHPTSRHRYISLAALASQVGLVQEVRHVMATIAEQLQIYRVALAAAERQGDGSTRRKIEQQFLQLQDFQRRHPKTTDAPSPMEMFCDLNPSDIHSLVYDDCPPRWT
jgi:hypothetical protein